MIKKILAVVILAGSVVHVHARPPKSLAGVWVATVNSSAYWMSLSTGSPETITLIEDVEGSLSSRSLSAEQATTSAVPVTGQYLLGNRVVLLSVGEPGPNRLYAIGECPTAVRDPMILRFFRFRPASGPSLEYEVPFYFRRGSSQESADEVSRTEPSAKGGPAIFPEAHVEAGGSEGGL